MEDNSERDAVIEVAPYGDVIVYCGDLKLKCSRTILATRSEYFHHVIDEMASLDEGIYLEEVNHC
jgi:hypothetical protein